MAADQHVGRAARDLITAIREAAGDYWAEIRLIFGFALRPHAGRPDRAGGLRSRARPRGSAGAGGHRTAASGGQLAAPPGLHEFANRVMRYTPPAAPTGCASRRIIDDLGQRQDRPGQPGSGRHAARSAGGTRRRMPRPRQRSFPVMVTGPTRGSQPWRQQPASSRRPGACARRRVTSSVSEAPASAERVAAKVSRKGPWVDLGKYFAGRTGLSLPW